MNLGKVNYDDRVPPKRYKCGKCGAKGVKLWREYNTFLEYQTLYCAKCASKHDKNGKKALETMRPDGLWDTSYGWTDQLGGKICAVPTVEGDTCWGYTSVPLKGCEWWKRLPNEPGKPGMTDEQIFLDKASGLLMVLDLNLDTILRRGAFNDHDWYGCKSWCEESLKNAMEMAVKIRTKGLAEVKAEKKSSLIIMFLPALFDTLNTDFSFFMAHGKFHNESMKAKCQKDFLALKDAEKFVREKYEVLISQEK